MSSKTRAIFGILGGALVAFCIQLLRPRGVPSEKLELRVSVDRRAPAWLYNVEIDDDTAAEIIKRASPALLRARELYAH